MPAPPTAAWRALAALEGSPAVDRIATAVNQAVHRVPLPPAWRDLLSGTWLGHPAHPMMVVTPIGCWTGAAVLDVAGVRDGARTLVGAGVLSAVPAALTGLSDWADTTGAEQRVGVVHLSLNLTATGCYAASWWARRRGRRGAGLAWSALGAGIATVGAWLGGHLSYALGVGVDTNAFYGGPQEWTPVEGEAPAPGTLGAGAAGGVALLLAGTGPTVLGGGDQPQVLANRCSHRGGPLSDGELVDGCVKCPWHGSRFDLATGEVRQGPATAPQPVYEVRRQDGRLQVRRREERSLRANPARPG